MQYKAQNIDTDRMLKEIECRIKDAQMKHNLIIEAENARHKQEMEDLERFERMFYCSNYEKKEKGGADNGNRD